MLFEQPDVTATLVVPYWPAQAWFQQLVELASLVEVHALTSIAAPPAWLPGSARTALTGAMLTYIHIAGRRAGATAQATAVAAAAATAA